MAANTVSLIASTSSATVCKISLRQDSHRLSLDKHSGSAVRISDRCSVSQLPQSCTKFGLLKMAFKDQISVCAHATAFSTPESTLPGQATEHDGQRHLTVGDVMTSGQIITARVDTTVDEALEALVENRVTGMPVVDDNGRLLGVVSDYDLLALDNISGPRETPSTGLFPQANSTWKAFKELQKLLIKTKGQVVGDVMTPSPLCVRPLTNLEDAARILLDSKFRRLPVVDDVGVLVGIITRGNVIRVALEMKKKMEAQGQTEL